MSQKDIKNSYHKTKSKTWIIVVCALSVFLIAYYVIPLTGLFIYEQKEWVVNMEGKQSFNINWEPDDDNNEKIAELLEPIDIQACYNEISIIQGLNSSLNFTRLHYPVIMQDQANDRHLTENLSITYEIEYVTYENLSYEYNATREFWEISPYLPNFYSTADGLWVNSSIIETESIEEEPVLFNNSLVVLLHYDASREYTKNSLFGGTRIYQEYICCYLCFSDENVLQSVAFCANSADYSELI